MAKRIAVVLSQSPTADAYRRDREEELVAQLLMEHSVDVTLVPFLGYIDTGDTAFLCLEGTTSDMILISWLCVGEAQETLQRLGIIGRRGRTTAIDTDDTSKDSPQQTASKRTIYHLDLKLGKAISDYTDEVRRIRQETSQPIFQLDGPGIVSSAPQKSVSPKLPRKSDPKSDQGEQAADEKSVTETTHQPSSRDQAQATEGPIEPLPDDWDVEEAKLDDLIDRLNDLD